MRMLHKPDALRRRAMLPLLAALLAACSGGQMLYHDYRPLPEAGWRPTDTLRFDFEIPRGETARHLSIGVRIESGYPYRNLPLALCCTDSDNRVRLADTLNLSLADEEGKRTGTGLGGLYQTEQPLPPARLQGPQRYTLKVVSLLPDTLLHGINDIDLAVAR